MEIFLNLWNNWSNIEKISVFGVFLIIFLFLPFAVKLVTKNQSLFLITGASLISSAILTLFGILALSIIFDLTITYIFLLTPLVILFVNTINIGTCVGYYNRNRKVKNFSTLLVKKEFLKDTTQLSIFILLFFSAITIFLSSTFLVFIILTGLLSVGSIWINYALLYRLLK